MNPGLGARGTDRAPAGLALGISASARRFSIAVRDPSGAITTVCPEEGGAGDLAATVAAWFAERGHRPSELGELRVDVGPGSYTGLRVAVTFARIAAGFGAAPLFVATSLELAALAAWNSGTVPRDRIVRPVLDARRNRYHHAPVRLQEHVELLAAPVATELPALVAAVADGEVLLAERALHDRLRDTGAELVAPAPFDAADLFDPRLRPRPTTTEQLEPLYLMGSYAE